EGKAVTVIIGRIAIASPISVIARITIKIAVTTAARYAAIAVGIVIAIGAGYDLGRGGRGWRGCAERDAGAGNQQYLCRHGCEARHRNLPTVRAAPRLMLRCLS